MNLNVKAFALTSGLVWGLGVFLLTWWIIAFDGSAGDVTLLGRVYRGYSLSPLGSLIGMAWALVDGLIGGALFAWLYNFVAGGLPHALPQQSGRGLASGNLAGD